MAKETPAATPTVLAFDPSKVKVVRNVTIPLLKMADGDTVHVTFKGEIFKGKELKTSKEGEAKMAAADLANVVDLTDGGLKQIIVNAVLKSTMEEEYPKAAYVGKSFRITRAGKEGKRYKTYTIDEIAL